MSKTDFYCIPKKARKVYAPRRHQQSDPPLPAGEARDKPERRRARWLPWSVRGTSTGR